MSDATGLLRDVIVPDVFLKAPDLAGAASASGLRRGDLRVANGRIVSLDASEKTDSPRLVMPWLVEAHCHLDKCHTSARLGPVGGDLRFAIEAQRNDKQHWSEADLRTRGTRGLCEAMSAGCRLLRSHVDWGEDGTVPLAWDVLGEVAQDQNGLTFQRAALTSAPHLLQHGAEIARNIAASGGVLGLFVLDQPERRESVVKAIELAERIGLALDFHVDEGLSDGLNGLELIADLVIEARFQGPVLCGHACSLMNWHGAELHRILEKIARSGIYICALPTTNLYLQGRQDGTPDRRGITRLRELHSAGVPIVIGSDNVADAFCPTGQHDPLAALNLAVLGAHLDPPLGRWLASVTRNAAKALGKEAVWIEGARMEDLAITEGDIGDLIAGRSARLTPLHLTSHVTTSA
ncbi:MAG: amidohydrolase family protein [Arenibacterium sp.]